MARKAGPFPDSPFYEVENRRLQRAFNPATGFVKSGQGQVTAGTGAELVIAAYPDGALIDGLYVENPTTETVTLTTNSGNTNPRIDRLVMRLDMTALTIAPYQIVGTPAPSPAVPPLVKTDTVVDMPLCRYTMPGSASAQNPGSIIDEREYSGPVTGTPTLDGLYKPVTGSSAPIAYNRLVRRMSLQGSFTHVPAAFNAPTGSSYQFATLPAGTAPAALQTFVTFCWTGTANSVIYITVGADGALRYVPAVNLGTGAYISVSGVEWLIGL